MSYNADRKRAQITIGADDCAPRCPHCQFPCRPGEIVCSNCDTVTLQTTVFSTTKQNYKKALTKSADKTARFIVLELAEGSLPIPLVESITIGRFSTGERDIQPDIGLNGFGAELMGVSHFHAQLLRKETLIYIVDLESTNGTFVNGQRLTPYIPELLCYGDTIRLGGLEAKYTYEVVKK